MISRAQGPTTADVDKSTYASPPAETAAARAEVLPAPDLVGGDPVAMMAKLFVKNAQQKRESDDLAAKTEEQAEDAADARRIEAMKERADNALVAGFVGGASQAASGACSIGAGVLGARANGESAARNVSSRWEGAGNMAGGTGRIGEALFKHAAEGADQDVARAESGAKVAKRAQDALRKEVDAAAQHEGKVLQLLQEIKQAQAQCERAALLRMA